MNTRRIRILDAETGTVLHEGTARPIGVIDHLHVASGVPSRYFGLFLPDGSVYAPCEPMQDVDDAIMDYIYEDNHEPETVASALATYAATGVELDPMAPMFMSESLQWKSIARQMKRDGKYKEAADALTMSYLVGGLCRWVQ